MKYVMKFLCAVVITMFVTSCASSNSGCYDFGENSSKDNIDQSEIVEFVVFSKNDNKCERSQTISVE